MVKSDWKNHRHHKQQHKHALVTRADNQQEKEANEEDHDLGRHDVCEDCADKKAIFTLKKGHAVWAVMPDVKRFCNDPGFAAGGTK